MEVGDEALAVVIVEILGRSAEYGVLAIPLVGAAHVHLWWLPEHGVKGWTGEPRDRYLALVTRARR